MANAFSWRLHWGWAIAVPIAGLLLLAYAGLSLGPKPPVYQGKDLYAWSEKLRKAQQNYSGPEPWKQIEAASTAIRAMGTNALPFVMADIRARPTVRDRIIGWLAPRARFLKLKPGKVEERWV